MPWSSCLQISVLFRILTRRDGVGLRMGEGLGRGGVNGFVILLYICILHLLDFVEDLLNV